MISNALTLVLLTGLVQDPLPDELLSRLKQATVLVRIQVRNATVRSGTGLLYSKDGGRGVVVTSTNLVERLPKEGTYAIQIVLNSGLPGEKVLEAEFAGHDHFLGVLSVDANALPQTMSPAPLAKLKETLPVYSLGFPFADDARAAGWAPSLSVTRGRIARLPTDKRGGLSAIHVDSDLIPGAAVVDSEGGLIGMATYQQWALPTSLIEESLLGRVTDIEWTMLENRDGTLRYRLRAMLVDPRRKIGEVAIRIGLQDRIPDRPKENAEGMFGRLEGDVREIALKRDDKEFRGEIVLKGDIDKSANYVWQWWWIRGDGKKIHTRAGDKSFRFEKDMKPPPRFEEPSKPSAESSKPRSVDPEPGDWLEDRRRRPTVEALKPEKTGTPLAGDKATSGGAQWTRLNLNAEHVEACLAWSEGCTAAIVMDRSGLIRRVSIPELKEEIRLKTWRQAAGLTRFKSGLVVYCVELQELWVLDDKSLEIRKRIPAPQVTALAASMTTPWVYVISRGNPFIQVFDAEKGEVVKKWEYVESSTVDARVKRHERSGSLRLEGAQAAVTPDGNWLLVASKGSLHRLKISGADLTYEEAGPALSAGGRIEISADSKYATVANGMGHTLPPGAPRVEGCATLIFKVEDLQNPVITLVTRRGASVLAFDREARRLYTAEEGKLLISFSPQGERAAVFDAGKADGSPRQFLVHPSGKRLFILNDGGLYWMELAP